MEQDDPRHYGSAVHMLAAAVIILNVVGNVLLRVGMTSVGEIVSISPLAYLKAFANLWIISGVITLTCWMLAQLSLLSWADLTYVLPVTSVSYVLIGLIGVFVLHERMTAAHWIGIALILAGIIVVGRTKPRTSHVRHGGHA
jgi:uncharacterized membrane protein